MDTAQTICVTGAAGFIGFHVAARLLKNGYRVVGCDNLNDYYDPGLKKARIERLEADAGFKFYHIDLCDTVATEKMFSENAADYTVHLAAQPGIPYSLKNPRAYIDSNIVGFLNVLEQCRVRNVSHLVYATSSSVYGLNEKLPFSELDAVDHPVSLYAATKKSNELMAHVYSHLFGIPTTGLRFFTVYGPWGRPDMAIFKFVKAVLEGTPIDLYNGGKMKRDFTYIDDIVEGTVQTIFHIPQKNPADNLSSPASGRAPYILYNIGNNHPVELQEVIATIEKVLQKKAVIRFLPMQPGDVLETFADIDRIKKTTGFVPKTPLEDGIQAFADWYQQFYI